MASSRRATRVRASASTCCRTWPRGRPTRWCTSASRMTPTLTWVCSSASDPICHRGLILIYYKIRRWLRGEARVDVGQTRRSNALPENHGRRAAAAATAEGFNCGRPCSCKRSISQLASSHLKLNFVVVCRQVVRIRGATSEAVDGSERHVPGQAAGGGRRGRVAAARCQAQHEIPPTLPLHCRGQHLFSGATCLRDNKSQNLKLAVGMKFEPFRDCSCCRFCTPTRRGRSKVPCTWPKDCSGQTSLVTCPLSLVKRNMTLSSG